MCTWRLRLGELEGTLGDGARELAGTVHLGMPRAQTPFRGYLTMVGI